MPSSFPFMPVDKTTIKSHLRIHPDLFANPNDFISRRDLKARSSKPTRGRRSRNLTLKILNYRGIEAKLSKVDGNPLTDVTIHFNPGVCLYGHNGSVLPLREFLDALGLLRKNLTPILLEPDDWVDLIPGLRLGGVAYWDYLEVPFHVADPEGTLLGAFRNARRPRSQIGARHWENSISFGGQNSDLKIGIYRKAVEMVSRGRLSRDQVSEYQQVLRFEVRLKGGKLTHYLGNERNVERIDAVPRLVRFYPNELVDGLRRCLSAFQGVYKSSDARPTVQPKEQVGPLGKLLARIAMDPRCPKTFHELLESWRFYMGAHCTTRQSRRRLSGRFCGVRDAGMVELSRRSSLASEELFSDDAFRAQQGIGSPEEEKKVSHETGDLMVHPLIYRAYQPPDQPFTPMTQWPSYLRV